MIYTEEEKRYMRMLGLNFDLDNPTEDEWVEIEETVGDRLQYCGFNENYEPTSDGLICEAILDKLP